MAAGVGLYFGVCAALHLTHVDPVRWFLFYVLTALLALRAPDSPWVRRGALIGVGIAVLWGLRLVARGVGPVSAGQILALAPVQSEGAERSRELVGLVVASVLLTWVWYRARLDGVAAKRLPTAGDLRRPAA